MKHRIIAVTGLTALTALSLAIAGCNSTTETDSGGNPTKSTAKADPRQELADAAAVLGKSTYKITMVSNGTTETGSVDPVAKKAQLTMSEASTGASTGMTTATTAEVRMIGNDMWMNIPGLPASDGKWMHLDIAQLSGSLLSGFGTADDLGGSQALLKSAKEVESLGDGKYKGTIDLANSPTTKSMTSLFKKLPGVFKSIGPDQWVVPFEATVDSEHRPTSLSIDESELIKAALGDELGAATAAAYGKVEMKFSDFGTKVDVQAPPANEVGTMSDDLLKMFGG